MPLKLNWQDLSVYSVQFISVAQSCLTLCDPMDCSIPGFYMVAYVCMGKCWCTHMWEYAHLGMYTVKSCCSVTKSCLTLQPHWLHHARLLSPPLSLSLLKFMSIELVMLSNHLICCPLLLLPSIFPRIRGFSNDSALCIRWPKDWSFSFSVSPSNEYSGWFPLGLTCLICMVCMDITVCLSIYLLKDIGLLLSWQLWIKLLWTFLCRYLYGPQFSNQMGKY